MTRPPPRPGFRSGLARLAWRLALAVAVAFAVALLAPSPARAGDLTDGPEPAPPDARLPPPGAERFVIHLRYPAWQYQGRFRVEGPDGTLDEGVARDQGGAFGMASGEIERVLEGAKGTLRLRVKSAVRVASGIPLHFGRWTIVEATGAFAGLAGGGTSLSTTAGDSIRGSSNEIQTLIGCVERTGTRAAPRPVRPRAVPRGDLRRRQAR